MSTQVTNQIAKLRCTLVQLCVDRDVIHINMHSAANVTANLHQYQSTGFEVGQWSQVGL